MGGEGPTNNGWGRPHFNTPQSPIAVAFRKKNKRGKADCIGELRWEGKACIIFYSRKLGHTAYNIPSPPIMGGADREKGRWTSLMAYYVPFPYAFPPLGERRIK